MLDACSLQILAHRIPDKFFDPESALPLSERPKTYLDLLKLLPNDVVSEIHLSNIVVEEATDNACWRDDAGKLIVQKISNLHNKLPTHKLRSSFLYHALHDNGDAVHPKIVIDCTSEGNAYIRDLVALHDQFNAIKNGNQLRHLGTRTDGTTFNNKLIEMREFRRTKGRDLGEIESGKLALNYVIQNKASAMVLTEDGWAIDMIAENKQRYYKNTKLELDVESMNCRVLFQLMRDTGLLQMAGFKKNVSEEAMSRDIMMQMEHELHDKEELRYPIREGGNFTARLIKSMATKNEAAAAF